MKLLLHVCCAPCLIGTLLCLKEIENIELSCFCFNPNIHPYTEYKSRLSTLENYTQTNNIALIIKDYYGLREFVHATANDIENRCEYCYNWRIKECAEVANLNNFDAFTTTLLVSPYQKHEMIKTISEKWAKIYNCSFFYKDFRASFRLGQKQARESGVYMQKYCGCIFSEEERYSQ